MATSAQIVPDGSGGFAELDTVLLTSVVGTSGGTILPGALGTIVYRHAGGEAYEVEFTEPVAAVVTLRLSDLTPAP